MSPWLYIKYTSMLITLATESLLGIEVGNTNISITAFADDLMLITDNITKAQKLIDIVSEQGEIDDILFNPKKSGILSNDPSKPTIKIKDEMIKYENEMRYLGVQLSYDGKQTRHVKQRNAKAVTALATLRSYGLLSNNLNPYTKAFLFKTYIRPIIYYGINVFQLSITDVTSIKKTETLIIKQIIGVNKQLKNTALLSALNIMQTERAIMQNKMNFYIRLLENDYTKKLLEEVAKENKINSITADICETLNLDHTEHLDMIWTAIHTKLAEIDEEEKSLKATPEVNDLKEIIQIRNHALMVTKLREKIGFLQEADHLKR